MQVHIAVSHHGSQGAPVVIEDNPSPRSLFGCIENPPDSDMLPDVSCLRAGSLHQAHGGFLMLHLRDVMASEGLWDRLRRFLRNRRLQFDDASTSAGGNHSEGSSSQHLQPQAIEANVKIVLLGSVDAYYELHEHDPETARRFQAKVDFADSLAASAASYRAIATLVAHTCKQYKLPPLSAAAVARILEYTHREAEDQHRQTALLGQVQTLLVESAAAHHLRNTPQTNANTNTNGIVSANANKAATGTAPTPAIEAADIDAALKARALRHNYPEEQLLDSITEGERLITLHGSAVGQINALTQVDLGDHRFGLPVRITARTYAGHEGLMNIEREVDMSGPIHDKGVLILHSYLTALFSHMAPLALNASIVFEQEYSGVEGDSASCAELYALLSSLSGLPLQQNIAVTGALNQHGEVLPVGGINDKIEGWFNVCQQAGLTGTQGVLIPARNQRHLMLSPTIQNAVACGQFQVYAVHHVSEGIALLTGQASGMQAATEDKPSHADHRTDENANSAVQTVLSLAQATLHRFRRACQTAAHTRAGRRGR
jgi:predicted ATP-dependent protease